MNLEDAQKLCPLLNATGPWEGFGHSENRGLLERLKSTFPEVPWRIILNRSGERTSWDFTVLADDPREHYVAESHLEPSGKCMHCGKSGKELGLPIRHDD